MGSTDIEYTSYKGSQYLSSNMRDFFPFANRVYFAWAGHRPTVVKERLFRAICVCTHSLHALVCAMPLINGITGIVWHGIQYCTLSMPRLPSRCPVMPSWSTRGPAESQMVANDKEKGR